MLRQLGAVLAVLAQTSYSKILEVENTLPNSPVPYVVRHLDGPKLQLADDVFRTLTDVAGTTGSNNSQANGFGMLLSNAKPGPAVPPHYHVIWHETFIPMIGGMRVWLNGKPRDLMAGDFAMVPGYQNHSYQITAQETEFMGLVQPAGFDEFFANISTPWDPAYSVPYPPDQPLPFPQAAYGIAAARYDINLINKNYTEPECVSADWHSVNGTIPADAKTPYTLANGEGPHHWLETAGAVISPLATPVQTDGNFTIAHIVMRKTPANETMKAWSSPDHQFIYGMAGELTVAVCGEDVKLIQGDSLFLPAYTEFTLKNEVNYNKFLFCSGGPNGVDTQMIQAGKTWGYSTPPAH